MKTIQCQINVKGNTLAQTYAHRKWGISYSWYFQNKSRIHIISEIVKNIDYCKHYLPVILIVPAQTRPPTSFSMGNDSPVKLLSSIALLPEAMIPSIGIDSPALTQILVPTLTSATGTLSPLSARTASWGAKLATEDIASRACDQFMFNDDGYGISVVSYLKKVLMLNIRPSIYEGMWSLSYVRKRLMTQQSICVPYL